MLVFYVGFSRCTASTCSLSAETNIFIFKADRILAYIEISALLDGLRRLWCAEAPSAWGGLVFTCHAGQGSGPSRVCAARAGPQLCSLGTAAPLASRPARSAAAGRSASSQCARSSRTSHVPTAWGRHRASGRAITSLRSVSRQEETLVHHIMTFRFVKVHDISREYLQREAPVWSRAMKKGEAGSGRGRCYVRVARAPAPLPLPPVAAPSPQSSGPAVRRPRTPAD